MFGSRLPTLLLCISMGRHFLENIYFPSGAFFRVICCFVVSNALNILIFFFEICCKSLHLKKKCVFSNYTVFDKNSVQFYVSMNLLDRSSFNAIFATGTFFLTNKRFRRRQIFRCINDEVATFISFDRDIKW